MFKRLLTVASDHIFSLPIIVLMPHSSCNCRCIMCDIWKANNNKMEISAETLEKHIDAFRKLNVREVVFSGGEALMHSNLWKLCALLRENNISITLLSTGLLLKKHATEIIANIQKVIVSVDGSEHVHDKIRNIPNAFEKLREGIGELRKKSHGYPITGRCVLQRHNFSDLINIVKEARIIGLDQISFLAADVSTSAFNRPEQWTDERVGEVALNMDEALAFESIVEDSFIELRQEYKTHFIAESEDKMRKLVQYYKAVNHAGAFPQVECNAPWVSAVIESDGSVLPCFFHKPYGNLKEQALVEILNSKPATDFRRNLNIKQDEICKKCVCSLKLAPYQLL